MQIKTIMRYHLTPVRMAIINKSQITNAGGDVEKREASCTVGGTVQPLLRTLWRYLRKLYIELPYNPAIPLLGKYPDKTLTFLEKDTCTPIFIAALFTIAKTWKQPKCPSTDDCIRKMWYIYNGILLSHKKNKMMPFAATWMKLKTLILSEIRKIKINII